MKRKLQFLSAIAITVFMGTEMVNAQTNGAFGGTTPSIGHLKVIEFERFDVGANADATVNPSGVTPFGYSDKSAGNSVTSSATVQPSSLRTGTDVDVAELVADTDFKYVTGIQGGEYLYYTVTVGTSGKYHIDVNYAHSSTANKRYKIEKLSTDFSTAVTLVDGTTDIANGLPKTANASTFATASAGPSGAPTQFDLATGESFVIKFTFNDAGPSFNYFQFIRDGNPTLGVDSFDSNNTVNIYPNPSATGIFQLGESTKWEVYSVLGARVAQGEGTEINLSAQTKGVYVVKTAKGATKVVFQ
ncbi:T9SS type A sorting domain-containing protein [Flavobacterium fluviatile]|uniref:T9SS type A sorting domain-containing protein n=1 Tax=Flavobacterium fluviatile TaxID=1862387 RepID=UPI0013D42F7F|nr:T9SS type A sorting domain-containing protein [Flavobacterium fluviatile]